ncbi:hypothetical protein GbCGDNIH2_5048 [Granulibacter bethesdensis]|uniref:Uncharacterized protein n=2 Tax=Granulibacter bethesdensis TaxID=364410 RepID=A0A286M378_GRABC|nr:hypothetical protein GbCGDNIH3_5048 [Granulibacter bethesdensis]AHJ65514.1 hypothetical protein GbCGDNIH4_5048 [Granulibacter bethesdensis CGDNIH4]ASV62477.1 hypothetical protein GbCGDNIH1_5048 [Granulibacter bethesdensis CGDNIH1]AHJ68128.1 hypothetical protein GbCGDNIH2_5048 [Granulibacter bethesdensis]APH52781.1 hypothetical protein GbCGDNIH5_5048 [Granulibacter bethesdensis]
MSRSVEMGHKTAIKRLQGRSPDLRERRSALRAADYSALYDNMARL